jgi:protein arginine kinase
MKQKTKFTNDIAISTRIRLARNIVNIPFPTRANDDELLKVRQMILDAVSKCDVLEQEKFRYEDLDKISDAERISLVERHLISLDLGKYAHSSVLINKDETISIMINEEDHIRIQCILSGFALTEAYEIANKLDDILQQDISYSFSDKYGFLTSCPTNVGTGMRAGVMVHIPALVLKSELNRIVNMAGKYGLTVRGIYGEGSSALGDLFQVSNQNSLGLSEDEIIRNLHAIAKEVIKMERAERNALLIENEDEIKDKVSRAYGLLTNAHMMSAQEAMKLLSLVRMGVDINIIDNVSVEKLNNLMINIQPATLSLLYKVDVGEKTKDIYRAEYIHNILGSH